MLFRKIEFIENIKKDTNDILSSKNILLIGAGGIGCELLKSLVLIGLKKISIVDLDKVEKSNLNRQFLFDSNSIGKYKSIMARESIIKMTGKEDLEIDSYVGNIKDIEKFNFSFFQKFDLILNALDNIDARSYINRICVMKNIPLINSGTEGFLGSVFFFNGKKTECYDCKAKVKKKTIPVCSIRSKPEKIEHCIAWGKALLDLFITKDNDETNPLSDLVGILENKYIGEKISQDFNNKEIIIEKKNINEFLEEKSNFNKKLFKDIFFRNISFLFENIFFDGKYNFNKKDLNYIDYNDDNKKNIEKKDQTNLLENDEEKIKYNGEITD